MIEYHRYALDKAGSWVLIQGFRKKQYLLYFANHEYVPPLCSRQSWVVGTYSRFRKKQYLHYYCKPHE